MGHTHTRTQAHTLIHEGHFLPQQSIKRKVAFPGICSACGLGLLISACCACLRASPECLSDQIMQSTAHLKKKKAKKKKNNVGLLHVASAGSAASVFICGGNSGASQQAQKIKKEHSHTARTSVSSRYLLGSIIYIVILQSSNILPTGISSSF